MSRDYTETNPTIVSITNRPCPFPPLARTETNFKGSSNSQDSFPAPGSAGASLDGYGGYPGGYPPGPGGGGGGPGAYNERPPSQNNAQAGPHPGKSGHWLWFSCFLYIITNELANELVADTETATGTTPCKHRHQTKPNTNPNHTPQKNNV